MFDNFFSLAWRLRLPQAARLSDRTGSPELSCFLLILFLPFLMSCYSLATERLERGAYFKHSLSLISL